MAGMCRIVHAWRAAEQWWRSCPLMLRHACQGLVLAALLLLGTALVHVTGGTQYAYPYLMLIPVLLAGAWYTWYGSLLVALAAGLLMAVIPLSVETGEPQDTLNWMIRLGLYLIIGGFAGGLFERLRQSYLDAELASRTDPRAGLPNDIALEADLARWLKRSTRQDGRGVGVVLVRVEDIGEIMEALGADASDELMVAISNRLAQLGPNLQGSYRVSGAELVLLFWPVGYRELERLARRVVDLGEDNLVTLGVPLRVQLVLGSSLQGAGNATPGSLIREARIAMLAASEKHRAHCHFQPSFARRSLQNIRLIARVRRGLAQGEFELHYQPKLHLASGRVSGFEGLIRWRDESGALIAPGMFMPKVENTTLIAPVTRFVMREACHFARRHGGKVSINFSVRNLMDDDLLDEFNQLVEETGISPSQLEVEITESALVHDLFAAKQALERIRGYGIQVSIDDFGTGFSSFEYLRHLPITGLKIDRAFVEGLEKDERARKLMACLIDVGHALDLEVTAEGVETLGQHRALQALGCDQAQGFLYSKALPVEELLAWHHERERLLRQDDALSRRRESRNVPPR
ncbi:GGDEF domain-containing protein [Halomonas sp. MCCC 1A17488]|uniref:GGDEF domain-containing protein n=1 Tax=Billgrantia sulfidoxydans TaxID=2733484 RepID=A0ABX7W699_9GAMM|nr:MULTISPECIES: bifunctional diguanylate cyclase/phosphodiesterase [Halomonas]MCE8014493.1 GGDEF domain-containing protein [Halomonas sp. MCCC 1A17488]MCG3237826.1 GGDEF domain-containing protein [Halomonas sp. MCCC 1A17488]QPP48380.1 GGDEF domain-containing protein [Halomonas sp. SS10-MC5]QTP55690.1 GGDEF domain-containing protein [Halomonas sulfidoxydans]